MERLFFRAWSTHDIERNMPLKFEPIITSTGIHLQTYDEYMNLLKVDVSEVLLDLNWLKDICSNIKDDFKREYIYSNDIVFIENLSDYFICYIDFEKGLYFKNVGTGVEIKHDESFEYRIVGNTYQNKNLLMND